MGNIICYECGTENEPQYAYCKNCGSKLIQDSQSGKSDADNTQNPPNTEFYGNNYNSVPSGFFRDTIDGNPVDDVISFVGTKAHKIVPKFSQMQISNSKTSWCWPAAILGLLFGPFGVAIWFFYRKMYKAAFITAAIGTVSGGLITLLCGSLNMVAPSQNILPDSLYDFSEYLDASGYFSLASYVESLLSGIESVASLVLGGLFSYHFYKGFVSEKIRHYRMSNIDPRYYKIGLASIGGTSGGMAVLGVFIMISVIEIFTIITDVMMNLF